VYRHPEVGYRLAFASPPAATYISLAAVIRDCEVPDLEFPTSPGSGKA
jgi:hypothetical protein